MNLRYLALAMGAAVLLGTVATSAASKGYYRWTDAQGHTHYTQNPPPDQPAEFIRTGTSHATPALIQVETAEGDHPDVEILEGLPEPDPELCRQAREVLESLDGYVRIRARKPDGTHAVLTEADKEEQREIAREAIELYCE